MINIGLNSLNPEPLSWDEAVRMARQTNRNILVRYSAEWCLPCRVFEQSVLNQEEVITTLTRDYIYVYADFDNPADQHLFRNYKINAVPGLTVLNPALDLLYSKTGALSKDELLTVLEKYKNLNITPATNGLTAEKRPLNISLENSNKSSPSKENSGIEIDKITDLDYQSGLPHIIQLGAFKLAQNALNFSQKMSKQLNMRVGHKLNQQNGLYYVFLEDFDDGNHFDETLIFLTDNKIEYLIKPVIQN